MEQLVCVSAADFISIDSFMHFIQRSNVSTTEKYSFMLITRNVYKYFMFLISNYCEFN